MFYHNNETVLSNGFGHGIMRAMSTILLFATLIATNLPTVTVEASRIDSTQMEMPSGIHVIGREEIAAANAGDVTDLLTKKAPELHIRHLGGGNPALAEISMRGYGENGFGRTLVLVDGERLNSPDLNTPNLSRIALGAVDRIEILGGPQTVLHGDGASAGVINVITEPRDYARKSYAELHGGSWGSFGGALGTRGGIEEDGIKYWADGSWDRSDGYRSNSRYDIWNLNAGLKKEWESGTSLRVSGFYNDSRYELPGHLSYDEWKSDPRQSHASGDDFWRATYGFNVTFNAQLNDENALKTTGNFSNRRMEAFQRGETSGTPWSSDLDYDIYAYRLLSEWINTTELLGFENEFILGAQYVYETLHGVSDYSGAVSDYDYNRQLMDFFAQDTFHITDGVALQPGARYSRAWAFNEQASPSKKQDHLCAADLALVWNPVDDAKIYLKGSRTYRNPFLDEIPYDPRTYLPAGLLDPETGWNAEIGFEWSVTDEFGVGGDVYCTWLEDEIFYDAVHGNNVNAEDWTVRHGFDLHADWERERVAGLSAAFSYAKATFDGGPFGHNLIPLVPEVTLSLNGRVWLWDDCYVFGGYRFQSDMTSASDFNNDYDAIGWFGVFHLGATYEPTFAEWARGFKLTVTVDNLFDERYCDYATYGANYYPAAGRSFTVSLRYEF